MLFTVLLLATYCAAIPAMNEEAMKQALPAYAVADQIDLLNATRCRGEVLEFRVAVNNHVLWALRMLDASGEPGAGFTSGSNLWVGKEEQCRYLTEKWKMQLSPKTLQNSSLYRDPKFEYPPYDLNFFIARFTHNSTFQYHIGVEFEDQGMLGLCLPASCTTQEVGILVEKIFSDRTILAGQLYSADFKLIEVKDLRDDYQWLLSGKYIAIILIIGFMLTIVAAGTAYDLFIYQKCLRKKMEFLAYENNNTSELKGELEEKKEVDQEGDILSDLRPQTNLGQALICFSAYTNIKLLFRTEAAADSIPAIHGIKFLGMFWIIMVHTVFYALSVVDNKPLAFHMLSNVMAQIMGNATLSVDTFFFLSGFLLTSIYLKAAKREKKGCNLGKSVVQYVQFAIKRYIRITPAYLMVILLAILNFTWYDKFSVFYNVEDSHNRCSKYWWRNILYINNLFDWDELCLTWSWYLANDTQFFMFGSFLLLLSAGYPYISLGLGGATVFISIILNGYAAYSIDFIPTMDEQYKYLTVLYLPPWLRIPPYLVGMGTSVLLSKWNYKLNLSRKVLAACWTFSIVCSLSVLLGLTNKYIPLSLSVLYTALSRTVWSMGIAWCVIACSTNNGGIINDVLSFKVWIPLSRLTYCAYLLNPLLIMSVFLKSTYIFNVEWLTSGAISFGALAASFICAIALSLVAEMPFSQLFRQFLNSHRRMK